MTQMVARRDLLRRLRAYARRLILAVVYLISIEACAGSNAANRIEPATLNYEPLCILADEYAKGWHDDAYLVSADLPVWLRDGEGSSRIYFGARSRSERDKWLLVVVDVSEKGGTEVWSQEGTYPADRAEPNPIPDICEVIPSDQALELLSANGGDEFVAKYQDGTKIDLILEYADPYYEIGPMTWNGHYSNSALTNLLVVEIDAFSGELIRAFDPSFNADEID